ncbi:ATP-binding protein [Sphingomonas sp.]|uniref:ATP-binding protein n=1 Tax=Sphingomonas sp. TaxID=28214 RepID=UPI003AFFC6C8
MLDRTDERGLTAPAAPSTCEGSLKPVHYHDVLNLAATVTGREIAARDWTRSPLGPIESWPAPLRSLLAMMLACPTPMFLAWGEELTAFFNDAYRPILGRRLDGALGLPFRTLWGDIWDDIGPLVDATLAGESRRMVDMPLDLARAGLPEESWWTFTYSPVFDDAGAVAGLMCVTGETTDRILAERARDTSAERLQLALSAGDTVGTWDWDVPADRIVADARFCSLHGVDPERGSEGVPVAEFLACIHPEDLPRVRAAIGHARQAGEVFHEEYRIADAAGAVRWVSAQGRCVYDRDGRCIRFPGVSIDVTRRVADAAALRAAKEERDFIIALTVRQRELDTPEAVLRLSLEELGRRLGVDRTGFYRQLPDGRVRYGPCWTSGGMEPLLGEFAPDRFGVRLRRAREAGRSLSFVDAARDSAGGLDELAATGIVSGVCVPIMRHDEFEANFFVHHSAVRPWSAGEISLIREVGELTMLAVERAEATIRLKNRLDQQESALAAAAGELRDQAAGRAAVESQLRQLQKMEAVGQLTGGIAHDFNNMLAVIIGGLSLMRRRLERGETDLTKYIDAAMDGATRAAALTQRLLAFSRQAPLAPEPTDLNRMIGGLTELLTRTLGEQVLLDAVLAAGAWKVKVDPNQLENVIVNLAVNARDAMPDGGKLTIETANAHIDEDYAAEEGVRPGQYVLIAVTDTGTGMTPDVMARAFDPFFTTKGVGKGTGLGLSQVFGFVRQSGGHVKCYSEVGHGTSFKIYLPRYFGDVPAVRRHKAAVSRARGGNPGEVVLVVEDEERLRNFTVEALRELGYTVVHASDGTEALAMIEAGQAATLLFTDVVMPGMTGRQLADVALERLPGLKLLYTTGYTRNAVVNNGTVEPGTHFLPKPFGIDQLAAKVREVLDQD